MDLPYNLFPSLHITLRTILADTYARHTRGATRLLSHIWFSLIGFSTLFTYQHHVIDIIGGFALAAICFYVIRETPWRSEAHNPRNPRVGARYAAGAVLLALTAIAIGRHYGWPLWWPAICFGLVSAAYFGLGPAVYGKCNGRLPLSSRLLLLPMLLGQHASLRHYARRSDAWNQVLPNLWLGRHLSRLEAETALAAGVTAVIDLTSEFSRPAPFHSVPTLFLPVLDLTAPTPAQINQAVGFFQSHGATGVVYVHCKVGYSRSAAIAGACLISNGHSRSATDVIAHLRRVRPNIVIRPEAESALEAFAKSGNLV
jgi:hypothetical protein